MPVPIRLLIPIQSRIEIGLNAPPVVVKLRHSIESWDEAGLRCRKKQPERTAQLTVCPVLLSQLVQMVGFNFPIQ
jgi:hypothetical protein